MDVSTELPPMFQYAPLIEERFGVHVVRPDSTRQMGRRYGKAIFHITEAGTKTYPIPFMQDEIELLIKEANG